MFGDMVDRNRPVKCCVDSCSSFDKTHLTDNGRTTETFSISLALLDRVNGPTCKNEFSASDMTVKMVKVS